MTALEWILKEKIVAILRGVKPGDTDNVVEALFNGGITVLEITLNSEDALGQLRKISEKYSDRMLVGAGTVLDLNDAKAAREAGAKFLISPGLDNEVVKFAKQNGLVSIPGAFTPTEVMNAHKSGADIVKIFPVNSAEYIRNIVAPLNKIRMMPTGGINIQNIHEFENAGAVAFGIGSALVSKTTIADKQYLSGITSRAKAFTEAASSF